MTKGPEGSSHSENEVPKKKLENTAESIRSELNQGKRIDISNPINAVQVSIAWAKRNPDHPLSKNIVGLEQYGDLKNKEVAEKAVKEIKRIQATLGIEEGDGVIGPRTLAAYEEKDKGEEVTKAEKILTELDASLYGADLSQRTEKAQKDKKGFFEAKDGVLKAYQEGGIMGGAKELYIQGKEAFSGTKVTDAKGVEYTIKKTEDDKTQYIAKNGEVFELRGAQMVSLTKEKAEQKTTMTRLVERAKSETTGFTAENPLGEGLLSPFYNAEGVVVSVKNDKGEIYNAETGEFESENIPGNIPNTEENNGDTLADAEKQKTIQEIENQISELDKGLGDKVKAYLQSSAMTDRLDAQDADISQRSERIINNLTETSDKGQRATSGFLGSIKAKMLAGIQGFMGQDTKPAQRVADTLWNNASRDINDAGEALQNASTEAVRLTTNWKFDLVRGTFNELTASIQEEIAARIPETKNTIEERKKLTERLLELKK